MYVVLLLLWSAPSLCWGQTTGAIRVLTQNGAVFGTLHRTPSYYRRSYDKRNFYGFRGIPYAEPPIGDRRFKPPERYSQRANSVNAFDYRLPCPQYDILNKQVIGSEDCLYLNVFSPVIPGLQLVRDNFGAPSDGGMFFPSDVRDAPIHVVDPPPPEAIRQVPVDGEPYVDNGQGRPVAAILAPPAPHVPSGEGLPVIVFIHGFGHQFGSAASFSPDVFMKQDVVLVTLDYRLGVLGFLSTLDEEARGNYGLLDIIAALQWVKDNISYFGGNPERVTLMGHGSGGALVNHLLLSPRAQGLFAQAIIQSGCALCQWATEDEPKAQARRLAKDLDCPRRGTDDLVYCLKEKPYEEIVRAQRELNKFGWFPVMWAPVVDEEFRDSPVLPHTPDKLLEEGRIKNVPLMAGFTMDEGFFFYLMVYLEQGSSKMNDAEFVEHHLLKELIQFMYQDDDDIEDVIKAVQEQYFRNTDFSDQSALLKSMTEMLGDMTVTWCQVNLIERYSRTGAPTYGYAFTYRRPHVHSQSFSFANIIKVMEQGLSDPFLYQAVGHGDDLMYLFTLNEPLGQTAPPDGFLAELITHIWADFALTGNPTPHGDYEDQRHQWQPVDPDAILLYNLTAFPSEALPNYKVHESRFWAETVPRIQHLTHQVAGVPYSILTWVFLGIVLLLIVGFIIMVVAYMRRRKKASYTTKDNTPGE